MKILRIPSIPEDKVMLINISKRYLDELKDNRARLYEAIRKGWKINTNSAQEIDYVCCIANGIIVAVYRNTQWRYMDDSDNYGYGTQRLEFEGEEVVDSQYLGLDVSQYIRVQSPIRYVNYCVSKYK